MPRPRSRVRFSSVADSLRVPARTSARVIPSVDPWMAGEMFVSPHVEERRRGFAILVGSEAARRSSLTPYLLATRIDEPDLELRAQIVQALADYFELRGHEYRYPAELRVAIAAHLRRFERPHVLALLEAYRARPDGASASGPAGLAHLLERIPNASVHLVRAAGDKTLSFEVRQAAIHLIGEVGFTDALSALSGLITRLEGRVAGQLTMAFAPNDHPDDEQLLPALRSAIGALQEDQ